MDFMMMELIKIVFNALINAKIVSYLMVLYHVLHVQILQFILENYLRIIIIVTVKMGILMKIVNWNSNGKNQQNDQGERTNFIVKYSTNHGHLLASKTIVYLCTKVP